jgi:hypothetical protein
MSYGIMRIDEKRAAYPISAMTYTKARTDIFREVQNYFKIPLDCCRISVYTSIVRQTNNTKGNEMQANLKNLLAAVRDKQPYRGSASAYIAAKQLGYLVYEDTFEKNAAGEWGRGYVLTELGEAELLKAERKANRHSGNCNCPRCAMEHVKHGCRRIMCPVCG